MYTLDTAHSLTEEIRFHFCDDRKQIKVADTVDGFMLAVDSN